MTTKTNLPRDPYEAVRIENDIVGVRIWGPPDRPTLTLGKSDIWDRRWFGDRQPLITMAKIRELAMADQLGQVMRDLNDTVYDVYMKYDFPCPKTAGQVILGAPFAQSAAIERQDGSRARLWIEGGGKKLMVEVWVSLVRSLVVIELAADGLAAGDFWVRVYRHRDTIVPGGQVDLTLGGRHSPADFEQLPGPRCFAAGGAFGIVQDFPAEETFPRGFQSVLAGAAMGVDPRLECRAGEAQLGTPLWAEQEGRLNHMAVKRYAPINAASGAAATATFERLPESFAILQTVATTQDGDDAVATAAAVLQAAARLGLVGLRQEHEKALKEGERKNPARACVDNRPGPTAPQLVMPRLRQRGGYYGDVPMVSVSDTKFCFQDAGPWHADFHLNEIRAEGMLTLGQFPEVMSYCELIHTLLPQCRENARDVYGLPGAMYPLAHYPLRCPGVAHTNLNWEQDMGMNGLIAKPLWLYYRYTGDEAFLRDLAYPVFRECARFMRAYLTEENDGKLHILPTVSPEHWGLTANFERNKDATSALTLTRYLFRAAAGAARILGVDEEEATAWAAAVSRLAPYPTCETEDGPIWVDVAGAPPIEYNIPGPLAPIFWGDDVGLDSPPADLEIARRTLRHIRVWEPHSFYLGGCIRPRLGIWQDGAPISCENLLQSYQSIRIFPAVPPRAEIVMENYAAEGGFRVSAIHTAAGDIREVRIQSALGGVCRVAFLWPGRRITVAAVGGGAVPAAGADDRHLIFETRPGMTYELRPV